MKRIRPQRKRNTGGIRMKKEKQLVCAECGFPILVNMRYARHPDGTVLCEDCYKALQKKGVIG